MKTTADRTHLTGTSRSMMNVLSKVLGRSKFWCSATALAALAVSVPLMAGDDFSFNSVGSLPNVVDDGGKGSPVPVRVEPSFYVRGPIALFQSGDLILDEWGTGESFEMVEERTGWRRVEYRGDVHVSVDMRFLLTGEAEVGIAAGVRSAARYVASVDGLYSEGATLPADMALRLPIAAIAPRGLLDNRFEVETLSTNLQDGMVRGRFTMQQSENLLKISQDQ